MGSMIFNSWLDSLRQRISRTMVGRPRRRSRQSAGGELERLEDRTLLSVSALFSNANGVLQIRATDDNGPDSIEVSADGFGNVRVEANGCLLYTSPSPRD